MAGEMTAAGVAATTNQRHVDQHGLDGCAVEYAAAVSSTVEATLVELLTQVGVRGSSCRVDLVVGALETTSMVVTPTTGEPGRVAGYSTRVIELAIARDLLAVDEHGVSLTTAGHMTVNGVREVLGWPPLLVM